MEISKFEKSNWIIIQNNDWNWLSNINYMPRCLVYDSENFPIKLDSDVYNYHKIKQKGKVRGIYDLVSLIMKDKL